MSGPLSSAASTPPARFLHTSRTRLPLGRRTLLMGVINVTPDSFSDGGRFEDAAAAVRHGLELIAAGADLLDIGGESTRPGSTAVPPGEQCRRVVPVVRGLRDAGAAVPISVDTRSAAVARAALDAGADVVNDVSALRDDADMARLCAERRCAVVLMHMQGTPATMQVQPAYADVVAEVRAFLSERAAVARRAGVDPDRLVIDPGMGFGKSAEHNLAILRNLAAFRATGYPVLVGPSRKAFLGLWTAEPDPARRDAATAGVVAWLAAAGVEIVRVHNVAMMRPVVDVVARLTGGAERRPKRRGDGGGRASREAARS